MKSLERFIEHTAPIVNSESIVYALRKLGENKDIKTLLIALCKYSEADWAAFMRSSRILQGVLQSSMVIRADSALLDELMEMPHIAAFLVRVCEDDS